MLLRQLLLLSTVVTFVGPAFGITLGTAETFAVLGASTVTNAGATKIRGNLGVSPGTAVVGFPPGMMVLGTIHAGDAVAMKAQADLTKAYNAVVALPCGVNMTGQNLGGLTLTPGVYCFNTSAQLTGTLVLDFQNHSKASFIFQIGSTLATSSSSAVLLTNCTQPCSVFWQVGSSATLATATQFRGNIMALASVTLKTNVVLRGRALARTGAVTMAADNVLFGGTLSPPQPPVWVTGNGQIAVPRPNSTEPDATGTGRASFAFIADPTGKGTFFNYLNYVTGQRIYGLIDSVEVIAVYPDGSLKTVRFSGTCHNSLPECAFSATVQKSDEPGGTDQFGVAITGRLAEARSPRLVSLGQIQFR